MPQQNILLSVCIPAYNRPVWFKRALKSIIDNTDKSTNLIEIIVSDDSDNNECSIVTKDVLINSNITYRYEHNQPKLGMAANWNHSIQLASGQYILVLHDDDFILYRGIEKIIQVILERQQKYSIMLFGVYVADEQEKIIKKQLFKQNLYLPSEKALLKVLSNSSFIRFPSIVISRDVFQKLGYFNTEIGEIADLDMWTRILSKYGLFCSKNSISTYTVHRHALTTEMFTEQTIRKILSLFNKVAQEKILPSEIIEQSKSNFLHQFILAGTYRKIKQKQFIEARKVMQLFKLSPIRKLSLSVKWFFLRSVFRIFLIV